MLNCLSSGEDEGADGLLARLVAGPRLGGETSEGRETDVSWCSMAEQGTAGLWEVPMWIGQR